MSALPDLPAIGFTAAVSRAKSEPDAMSAADMCETLARLAELSPAEVRHIAGILGRLGDAEVAGRLREIAGRRKSSLKPLA